MWPNLWHFQHWTGLITVPSEPGTKVVVLHSDMLWFSPQPRHRLVPRPLPVPLRVTPPPRAAMPIRFGGEGLNVTVLGLIAACAIACAPAAAARAAADVFQEWSRSAATLFQRASVTSIFLFQWTMYAARFATEGARFPGLTLPMATSPALTSNLNSSGKDCRTNGKSATRNSCSQPDALSLWSTERASDVPFCKVAANVPLWNLKGVLRNVLALRSRGRSPLPPLQPFRR